jgi:ligand-binding sensor domain-containing protein
LWLPDYSAGQLLGYRREQLGDSSSDPPVFTLLGATSVQGDPLDASGDLWVSSGDKVVKYEAAQLAASGSPAPALVLSGLSGLDQGFSAFNPPPAELPISQR